MLTQQPTTNPDSKIGTPDLETMSAALSTTTFIRLSQLDSQVVRLSVGLLRVDGTSVISSISSLLSEAYLRETLLLESIQNLYDRLCQRMNLQRCKILFETLPNFANGSVQSAVLVRKPSGLSVLVWTGELNELQYQSSIDLVIASMSGCTKCPETESPQMKS